MVTPSRLRRGTLIEHKEHKWLSLKQAERVASDHLKEHPNEYGGKSKKRKKREQINLW